MRDKSPEPKAFLPAAILHFWLGLPSLVLVGCTTDVTRDGEALIYSNPGVDAVGRLLLGAGLLYLGICSVRGALKQRQHDRHATREAPSEDSEWPGTSQPEWWHFPLGMVMTTCGLYLVFLSAPNALLARVSVYPNRLVIRDSPLWFWTKPQEIQYSSIVRIEKVPIRGRRGGIPNDRLIIHTTSGPLKPIAMTHMYVGVFCELERALKQFNKR